MSYSRISGFCEPQRFPFRKVFSSLAVVLSSSALLKFSNLLAAFFISSTFPLVFSAPFWWEVCPHFLSGGFGDVPAFFFFPPPPQGVAEDVEGCWWSTDRLLFRFLLGPKGDDDKSIVKIALLWLESTFLPYWRRLTWSSVSTRRDRRTPPPLPRFPRRGRLWGLRPSE